MKKFTKIMSMVLLVAMCLSMMTVSAFAADPHVCNEHMTHYPAVAATCSTEGNIEYYICTCGNWYKPGGEVITDHNAVVVAKTAHTQGAYVPTVNATCQAAGEYEHYLCAVCGEKLDGANNKAPDLTIPVSTTHTIGTHVAAEKPTMTADGVLEHYLCSVCGIAVDGAGKPMTTTVDPMLEPTFGPFAVSGDESVDYSTISGTIGYTVTDPVNYNLTAIKAGNEYLVRGSGYSYDSATGFITIKKAALSVPIEGKSMIDLVFYAEFMDGWDTLSTSVGGFNITNSANITVDELVVYGLTQNKYIIGSGKPVSFQSNLTDPSCIKIFSQTTQRDIPTTGFVYTEAYKDMYTYSFDNSFLDGLDCGYYQIRCYYGNSYSEYKTPGTLLISDSNTTEGLEKSLYYTNSTQGGDDHNFKYVSGDEVPRIFCGLFVVDGARLQISSNGGKSWSNVNVHNYMIEQSNGDDTPYAWIKDTYLDSLSADTIYYFKVVVPAKNIGAGDDLVSNTIALTTGPTLKPLDTAKHVINSTKSLKFVASEKVTKVYVGNVQLTDENDFNVSNDGKTITLSPSFLNKRTAGSTYTIKVLTASGEYASTTFQILTTAQASASPRTGDTANIGLWTAFLLASGAAAVAVLPKLKKED